MTKTTRFEGLGGAMRSSGSVAAVAKAGGSPMAPGDEDAEAMDDEDEDDAEAEAETMEPEPEAAAAPAAPVASSDPVAAARAQERARVAEVAKAVAEDKNCKGKADLALSMLADDDYAGLSASGIVKILGKQTAAASSEDGSAMMAQMREQGQIDTGQGGDDIDAAADNHGWGKAHAKVAKRFGTSAK